MAIFVEQEKNGINFFSALVIILFAGGVLILTYYLFFAPAPLVDVVIKSDLQIISEVAKVDFNVSSVIDSPVFQMLKEYVPSPELRTGGRSNPFSQF